MNASRIKIFACIVLISGLFMGLEGCKTLKDVAQSAERELGKVYGESLSEGDMVSGLKAALEKGTSASVSRLSAKDAFAKSVYRLAIPNEVKEVGDKLRQFGFGSLVDEFEAKLNAAAESAVPQAKSIFVNAVKGMSIADARGILFGGDAAATQYFKDKTQAELYKAFYPKVSSVLNSSGTTKYWSDVTSTYNKLPGVKSINSDLNDYTSNKILDALFDRLKQEEKAIRSNPAQRTTDILRRVFAAQDK